ncbi:phage tail assembly protein [uncultured Nostoc sp.]|uniref:phage tail assembly protein n=1 Tax=uncultured Nostoc sp. TaxID=340711 RepID=UPI0035CAEE7A
MHSHEITDTEFEFILPRGLVETEGMVHRLGVMRLATAKDEIYVQKHRRTKESSAYGVLVMLSQVITRLGNLSLVTPELLEGLFTRDLAYLREFYNRINQDGDAYIPVECPYCNSNFQVEFSLSGES